MLIYLHIWPECSPRSSHKHKRSDEIRLLQRFSKPPPESGNGVTLFAICSLLRTPHKNPVSRTQRLSGLPGSARSCNSRFSTIYSTYKLNQLDHGKSSSKGWNSHKHWVFCLWRRGGIATVVVKREVTVGERWYVSRFQRCFAIERNRQCLCGS